MSETEELEQAFAAKGGGDFADDHSLPAGFAAQLPACQADPNVAFTERETHLAFARRLLGQLDSANNLVVKTQKCRTLRAELNALRLLDSLVR